MQWVRVVRKLIVFYFVFVIFFLVFGLLCRHTDSNQLQQRCIQVECSNKEARKRLTESNGTPAMDLGHMNVVLK